MKKLMLCLLIFTAVQLNAQITNDNTIFMLSTGLEYNSPIDNVDEIKIGEDHPLYMYLTCMDENVFGADSIHFKVSQYNSLLDTYFNEVTYSMNVDFDWEWCYKAIYLKVAGFFRIQVYADDRYLESTMIDVIDDQVG